MLVSACSVNVNRSSTASLETPEVIVTRASDDHQRSVESPSDLLWSTLSPADVFTTDNLRVPTRLPSSSSAPQVSISIINFYHSCEPSLATSVSNECSRKADILVVEIRPHQPLLCRLHWMKASERITYKVAVVAYKCQHGLAPCVANYVDVNPDDDYVLPHQRLWTFNVLVCPCRWQNVSCYSRSSVEQSYIARHCCPLSIFCCRLKSHLFSLSYPLSNSSHFV